MCVDMCVDMRVYTCVDMRVYTCVDMCIDMGFADTCVGVFVGASVGLSDGAACV